MINCYLGSKNKVKLEATREVLKDTFNIISIEVNSDVSKQPLSDEETIQGALNRAKKLPRDGIRIGLEAGVQIQNDILFLVNWGVLIDQNDNIYYAGGTRIPLDDFVKEELFEKNHELSYVMNRYLNKKDINQKEGAIGYFTNNQIKRKDIFVHIVKLLYGQYLRKESL